MTHNIFWSHRFTLHYLKKYIYNSSLIHSTHAQSEVLTFQGSSLKNVSVNTVAQKVGIKITLIISHEKVHCGLTFTVICLGEIDQQTLQRQKSPMKNTSHCYNHGVGEEEMR